MAAYDNLKAPPGMTEGCMLVRCDQAPPWISRSQTAEIPDDDGTVATFAGLRIRHPDGGFVTIPWTSVKAIRHMRPLRQETADVESTSGPSAPASPAQRRR